MNLLARVLNYLTGSKSNPWGPFPPLPRLSIEPGEIADQIVELTNQERRRHGLPALDPCWRLRQAARAHSQEMAILGYFAHESPSPDRRTLRDRARAAGRGGWIGENIFCCDGYHSQDVAIQAVRSWMGSSGHRANVLRPNFTLLGVGVSVRGEKYYATQVFGG